MADKQDKAPEKVRIKDSYRDRIEAESQLLGKSYLETLYFIIDCYFAFKKGAFPMQQPLPNNTQPTRIHSNHRAIASSDNTPVKSQPQKEDNGGETFTLDWDL